MRKVICHDEALDGPTSIDNSQKMTHKKPSAKERNHETLSHQKSLALGPLALPAADSHLAGVLVMFRGRLWGCDLLDDR